MKETIHWTRVLYITGVVGLIIGIIDPLEGAVIILIGSVLIALATYLTKDKHYKLFSVTLIMIIIGIFFLFYLSSLGGFGGTSKLSWWWGLLILPYPIGWLISIITLIVRMVRKIKLPNLNKNP
ncbi:hypothetical protein QWY90_10225 [Flavobacterium paronense]|uniref:Uncharacterized protein n=1 Tax=Flavobacterium paronense TaxID=1392775 RepID=A0ABV5GBK1_9FLAO|nr:hypothetical protein [Flavobacterium paronense]MDN3677692.1 hypothetical protein [Flavobacterium paronense]